MEIVKDDDNFLKLIGIDAAIGFGILGVVAALFYLGINSAVTTPSKK